METAYAIPRGTFDGILAADGASVSPPIYSTRYSAAQFDRNLFDSSGLDCPPHIARSVAKRQAEYFYGRLCARRALQAIGITGHTVHTGKQREPVWPQGVVGSISHNDEFAVAVAMRQGEGSALGIDVERVVEGESQDALIATVVSASELAYLQSLAPGIALGCALTIVFSAKESFFKACYPEVGRYFDFDAVTVTLVDPVTQVVELTINDTLSGRLAAGLACRVNYRFFNDKTVFTMMHC